MGITWKDLSAEAQKRIATSEGGAKQAGVRFATTAEADEYVAMRDRAPREAFAKLQPHEQERRMAAGAAAALGAKAGQPAGKTSATAPVWDDAMRARMRAAGLPTEPLPYKRDAGEDYLATRCAQQIAMTQNLGGALQRRAAIGPEKHDEEIAQASAIRRALASDE